jgi:hypothetical protein
MRTFEHVETVEWVKLRAGLLPVLSEYPDVVSWWLTPSHVPFLELMTVSFLDHSFVESALATQNQNLRLVASTGSPPIWDEADQVVRPWGWVVPPLCVVPETGTHIFFSCPAARFFGVLCL